MLRSPLPWLVLLVLPLLAAAVDLLTSLGSDYSVISDQATMELHVREIGSHLLEVGPFSRYGWSHPGPAIYYLAWPLYRLMGDRSQSFAVLALLVNAASLVGVALVVRRRLGHVTMIWTVLVLALYARTLGPHFLHDSWNPYLPVLPFLLAVVLLWTALLGDAWALPLAAVLTSFAVQSHIGYAPPVLAVLLTTGGLAVLGALGRTALRRRAAGPAPSDVAVTAVPRRRLLPWVLAVVISLLAVGGMWLPPLVEQLRGTAAHPGNLTLVWRYFRTSHPDYTLAEGVHQLSNAVGQPAAFLTGTDPSVTFPYPPALPAWTGVGAAVLLVLALGGAVVLRRWRTVALAVLTLAVAVTGVVSVSRVTGPLFDYLFKWVTVAGVLLWVVVGAVVVDVVRVLATRRGASEEPAAEEARVRPVRRGLRPVGALAALMLVVLTGFATVGSVRVDTPQTDTTGTVTALADATAAWSRAEHPGQLVRVDFAPTAHPVLVGTPFIGAGVLLALQKRGVDVRTLTFWQLPFGSHLVSDQSRIRYVSVVAYNDGSSPAPGPGQRVLTRAGEYEVYAGPVPVGAR